MKAVLENEVLRGYFEAIYEMNDYAKIQITRDGFYTQTLEPRVVAMIVARIPKEYFEELDIHEDKEIVFPVEKILKFLRNLKKDSKVEITLDDKNIVIKSNNLKRNFALPDDELLQTPKIPEIEFTASHSFFRDDFIEVLKAIKMANDLQVCDYITIESKDKQLLITANTDSDEVELKLYGASGEAKTSYSLEYIEPIFKRIFAISQTIKD